MNLNHKVIMVVGAGGLIGSAIASQLLNHGAILVAVDNNWEILNNLQAQILTSAKVSFLIADITNEDSIKKAIKETIALYGVMHGAVNAAYPRNKNYGRDFLQVSYADFCDNVALNLGGYFLFMQQCAKYAQQSGESFSLVNIASVYGVIPPRFNIYENTTMTMPVEYAAIKSALIHLSKYATTYMKHTNFRVNLVSPGGIINNQPENFIDQYKAYSRIKGMLDTDDILGAILFLLSDESKYICGQNVIVDDGFSL